jgi:probable phosphoglycerate mutase
VTDSSTPLGADAPSTALGAGSPASLGTCDVVAYIDGGARGNPGPAGYGVRIEHPDGTLIDEFCQSIGAATNNVAEYRGLLAALEYAAARGCSTVTIRSDSLLLVKQMQGEYRVKHPRLQPLYQAARALVSPFKRVRFEHVGRDLNRHADRLANDAMDQSQE